MTSQIIIGRLERQPLESFAIYMNDGSSFLVDANWSFAVRPNGAVCTLLTDDDRVKILSIRNITRIETSVPT